MFLNILSLSLLIPSFNINAFNSNQNWLNSFINTCKNNTGLFNKFGSYVKEFIENRNKSNMAIVASTIFSGLICYSINKYCNNVKHDRQIKTLHDTINSFAKEVLNNDMKQELSYNLKSIYKEKSSTIEKMIFILNYLRKYHYKFNDHQQELYKELCITVAVFKAIDDTNNNK